MRAVNPPNRSRTRSAISWPLHFLLPPSMLLLALLPSWAGETVSTARLLREPRVSMPAYGQRAVDPVLGTAFVRITEPGRLLAPDMQCDKRYCRHRYSSTQAWNADQSLFVITKGCGDLCFLDGRSFEPLFSRRVSRHHDCKWHPRDHDRMICVFASGIALWSPRLNIWTRILNPSGYGSLEFGPYKGNPTKSGDRVAVRARREDGALVAFVVDIPSGLKHPDIELSGCQGENQYVTVSPTGAYLYVAQLMPSGAEPACVFTIDGKLVQHWPEHHRPGHGDLTVDADGSDIYVGISKSEPDEFHVIKRRLRDGKVTSLIPYSNASHVSARNIERPAWVIVTFQGTYENTLEQRYPTPFYSEVVALRIDGSGQIQRLAQTHSALAEYLTETHASPSPDGTKIVWSSNWGAPSGPVSDFVTFVDAARLAPVK